MQSRVTVAGVPPFALLRSSWLAFVLSPVASATTVGEQRVSPGSGHYSRNTQHELPMAVNPVNPLKVITGADVELLK